MENRDRVDLTDFVDRRIVAILGRRNSARDLLMNFEGKPHDDARSKQLRPLSSIYQTDNEVSVSVDLPFVSKENIEVYATEDRLLIRAKMDHHIRFPMEGRNEVEFEGHCKDIELPLGIRIDTSKARVIFRNGILQVNLPKKSLGTRINVE